MGVNNSIAINWNMNVFGNAKFEEMISSHSWNSNDYVGWGNYYANLAWLYCIANDIRLDVTADNRSDWETLCRFIEVDYEKSIKNTASIACVAVNKLATLIYSYAFYCLRKQGEEIKRNKCIYLQILNCCDEESVETKQSLVVKKQSCEQYLQKGADAIDYLISKICNKSSDNYIVKEIVDTIKKFTVENPLPGNKKYKLLKEYLEGERCVVAYVFNQVKNGMRGYIAFSGFNECEDSDILNKLSRIESKIISKQTAFIRNLVKISESLGFILVIINKDVAIYKTPYNVYNGNIEVYSTLGKELANLTKKCKRFYSCGERKIFTAFYPKTPSICLPEEIRNKYSVGYDVGKLYIQKDPCGECCTGIKYEWENGHVFEVITQLYTVKI